MRFANKNLIMQRGAFVIARGKFSFEKRLYMQQRS